MLRSLLVPLPTAYSLSEILGVQSCRVYRQRLDLIFPCPCCVLFSLLNPKNSLIPKRFADLKKHQQEIKIKKRGLLFI